MAIAASNNHRVLSLGRGEPSLPGGHSTASSINTSVFAGNKIAPFMDCLSDDEYPLKIRGFAFFFFFFFLYSFYPIVFFSFVDPGAISPLKSVQYTKRVGLITCTRQPYTYKFFITL